MSSILNRAAARELIFQRQADLRPAMTGKQTRISEGTYRYLEMRLGMIIDDKLRTHGTVGKTINFGN